MSSSEASSSITFRSKKPLNQNSKSKPQDLDPSNTKTPEKPPQLRRRDRNGNVALSLKEVRMAAKTLSQSHRKQSLELTDQISSARSKIVSRPEEISVAKQKKESGDSDKLPEKYEILCEFFNCLDSALLLLRKESPIFTKISRKIELLTNRRFTHSHLAQLKFILPEVIEIKKTNVHDEQTSCMKPDLHITLNYEAIENDGRFKSKGSRTMKLRRVFRSRLSDFLRAQPEGHGIPEAELPKLYNTMKQKMPEAHLAQQPLESATCQESTHSRKVDLNSNINIVPASALLKTSVKNQPPAVAAFQSHSFRRDFSLEAKSTICRRSQEPPFQLQVDSDVEPSLNTISSSEKTSSAQISCSMNATPSKERSTLVSEEGSSIKNSSVKSTPVKLDCTPARLMTVTPASHPPPKRFCMSPDDDLTCSPSKLLRRATPQRSLIFDTPVKNNKAKNEIDNNLLDILPENLLQSIRDKERKAMEERDPAISQAKRRRQMIACLPKLFNKIHFLFQSTNRSSISKEELMFKIISDHFEIVDKKEVEDQLTLLLELVPDWISEKQTSGGDLLIRINKVSSPEFIRTRLGEAK
ncbi:hypothetical protein UlMin_031610 [Ulmus minor]